jgi:hypothetical protein
MKDDKSYFKKSINDKNILTPTSDATPDMITPKRAGIINQIRGVGRKRSSSVKYFESYKEDVFQSPMENKNIMIKQQ